MLFLRVGSGDEIVTPELINLKHDMELTRGNICPLEFRTIRLPSNAVFRETEAFSELQHKLHASSSCR